MLEYYTLNSDSIAFSTSRAGGVGIDTYASFNVNPFCGDSPESVSRNRALLCRELDIPESHLIIPHQTHDTKAREIDFSFLEKPQEERRQLLEGIDAVYTRERGICVSVSTADCIPVLLCNPKAGIVAAIHAGWRGTCGRIVEKTLQEVIRNYGVKGEDFQAIIGPGISLDSFEVGDEVYQAFSDAGFGMTAIARRYPAAVGEKWHIDLWECNRLQLLAMGVPAAQIQVAGICTYKQHETYFSARRLGIKSGRILTGILRK